MTEISLEMVDSKFHGHQSMKLQLTNESDVIFRIPVWGFGSFHACDDSNAKMRQYYRKDGTLALL